MDRTETDRIPDEEIVDRIYRRDETGLEALVDRYGALCTGTLRRILTSGADVEECRNDVWLAVWNAIPPDRPASLAAYVTVLARRIGIDRYRYHTREKRASAYTATLSELDVALPDPASCPNAATDGEDSAAVSRALSRFLGTLDRETRVLFLRRFVLLESVEDLAARFGMRENTVSARLYRAKRRLKKFLETEGIYL